MLFFKRKSAHSDFSAIGVDMHSHLIPGVDDGAKDIEDSINLITGLQNLGFHHLITTPHTLEDIHPNTRLTLQAGHALLDQKLPSGIVLNLSSEYNLDQQFLDQLDAGEVIPLPGNRLLIEFSQIIKPHDLEEKIFDIGIKGYQVILAHPERYLFFHKQFDYFKRLKEMGVEFQINAMSLTPHYGERINLVAQKLIDKEYIDFIGTDIHHIRHLDTLSKVPLTKHFAKLIDSGLLKNNQLMK